MAHSLSRAKAQIKQDAFRRTIDGSQVDLYTLQNSNGLEAHLTNYGGIVISLTVPDRTGKPGDVVLGYDNLNDYIGNTPYFGALIGRYGNRIAGADSRSMASSTSSRRTTAQTPSTGDARDSIRWSGRPSRSRPATDRP